jgi:hypothetical protein
MHLHRSLSFLLGSLVFTAPALAQTLELPRPSPSAKVTQSVGLTDISVDYSAPGVKGRAIWGGLVPYDKLWRAGANAVTKVTFSHDVKVAGKPVKAGTYAFFTIPGKNDWTLILNKDIEQMGTGANYKKALDVLRVSAKPEAIPMRERLAYQILDVTDTRAALALEWEKLRVSLPIEVDTDAHVRANLQALASDAWRPWNSAARYQLETKKDYDAGLALVEKSIQLKEDWINVWTKAQLLAAKGKFKEAYPLAQRANELGQKAEVFFFADDVKKALAEWKNK